MTVATVSKYILLNKVVLFVKPDEKSICCFWNVTDDGTSTCRYYIKNVYERSIERRRSKPTQVERIGNSYSVSGTNIDVTTFGGMTDIDDDGVAVFTQGSYDVTTDATSFSFTETATVGDSIYSTSDDSLSVGSVHPYSNQTSTAGGIQSVDESQEQMMMETPLMIILPNWEELSPLVMV